MCPFAKPSDCLFPGGHVGGVLEGILPIFHLCIEMLSLDEFGHRTRWVGTWWEQGDEPAEGR